MSGETPAQTRQKLVELRDAGNDYTRPIAQRLIDKHDAKNGGKNTGTSK